jgi:hypothetical protein
MVSYVFLLCWDNSRAQILPLETKKKLNLPRMLSLWAIWDRLEASSKHLCLVIQVFQATRVLRLLLSLFFKSNSEMERLSSMEDIFQI